MKPSDLDFEKELKNEQYSTEEYITGYHDGMWSMIGFVQREKSKGKSLDEFLEKMFLRAKKYDGQ